MSGSLFSQILLILSAPVLTRIYAPDAFGAYTTFTAILAIITMMSTGRYELAVLLPKTDKESWSLVWVCGVLSLVCGVLFMLLSGVIELFDIQILRFGMSPSSINPIFFLLAIFAAGINLALIQWMYRSDLFGYVGIVRVLQALTAIGFQIGVGIIEPSGNTMITGMICGQYIAFFALVARRGAVIPTLGLGLSAQSLKEAAERYIHFPKQLIQASIANKTTLQVPVLFLGNVFGPTVVGFFGLANRVVKAPVTFIGSAISEALAKKFVEFSRRSDLASVRLFHKSLLILILMGVVGSTLLFFIIDPVIAFAFGVEWMESATYVKLLSVYLCFQFAVSPFTRLFVIYEQVKPLKFFELTRLVIAIVGLVIGSKIASEHGAIGGFSVLMSVYYLGIAGFVKAKLPSWHQSFAGNS